MIPPQELIDIIRRDLDAAILKATKDIAENRAPDMETYCAAFGKINGLREARRTVDEIVQRINDPNAEHERQQRSNQAQANLGGRYF